MTPLKKRKAITKPMAAKKKAGAWHTPGMSWSKDPAETEPPTLFMLEGFVEEVGKKAGLRAALQLCADLLKCHDAAARAAIGKGASLDEARSYAALNVLTESDVLLKPYRTTPKKKKAPAKARA